MEFLQKKTNNYNFFHLPGSHELDISIFFPKFTKNIVVGQYQTYCSLGRPILSVNPKNVSSFIDDHLKLFAMDHHINNTNEFGENNLHFDR